MKKVRNKEDTGVKEFAGDAGVKINNIINNRKIIGWEENVDVKKQKQAEIAK